jgi:hypothetical protein
MSFALTTEQFENLIQRDDWGSLNFSEARADIALLLGLKQQMETVDRKRVPKEITDMFANLSREIDSVLQQIDQFKISTDNPAARRNDIVSRIKDVLGTTIAQASPRLFAIGGLGAAMEFSAKIQFEMDEARKRVLQIAKEAEAALTSVQETAARTGVSVHEREFASEVESLARARKIWLGVATALGVVALLTAYWLTEAVPPSANYIWVAQHIVTKVFIVGGLSAAAVWCGSIYRSISHQLTVNRHRMNALRTFKTFANSAETPEIRQAILLEVTRTIFGSVPTGYLQATESNIDSGSKVLETLSRLSKTTG